MMMIVTTLRMNKSTLPVVKKSALVRDDDIDDAEKLINYAILAIGTACVVSGTAGALDSAFAVAA